jgi:hypothetical protein
MKSILTSASNFMNIMPSVTSTESSNFSFKVVSSSLIDLEILKMMISAIVRSRSVSSC